MNNKLKNVAWYSRGGHLDLFCKLSSKLCLDKSISDSFFVCHTKAEEKKIRELYSQVPENLGNYLYKKRKHFRFDEKRIEELSQEYDFMPLKRILLSENFEFKHSEEDSIFHLVSHFDFWEDFLQRNNINFIFTEVPSILSTTVLWVVCKKLGIECISFGNWCIDGRLIFSKEWGCYIADYENTFNHIEVDKSSDDYRLSTEYLIKMQERPEKPKYTTINIVTGAKGRHSTSPFPKIPSFKQILSLKSNIQENEITYYVNKSYRLKNYQSWLVQLIRTNYHKFSNLLERNLDLKKERYFLFPLHTVHEFQNYSHIGLKYVNVLNLIEECSACVPLGHKLYVKEHPSFFPQKSISFYQSIKMISNVRLIHPDEDNFELIKNSEGVITTASTMGWEAFLLGKLVFMLVNHWSEILPGVYKVSSPENLAELLQRSKVLNCPTNQEKLKAIYVLYKTSFKGALYPISYNKTDENIENFIDPVKEMILS
jgi:hypothetical protein